MNKMRILWIVNIPFPEPLESINIKAIPYGGWLYSLSKYLKINQDIELNIAYPYKQKELFKCFIGNKIKYYSFNSKIVDESCTRILSEVNPDIVHIHGTEMYHSSIFQNQCIEKGIKHIISIQGLVSIIPEHLYSNLNLSTIYGFNLVDIIFRNNIYLQRKNYLKRSRREYDLIKRAKYVIGRTDFDKAIVTQYNPDVEYFHCNEILRDSFYEKTWSLSNCKTYSIFVSQAQSPIKGFHFVIEAINILKTKYPNLVLYVSGETRIFSNIIIDKLFRTKYESYIRFLIKKYKLESNIIYVGKLSEIEMRDQYLKSHIFVSASTIENESNSVSEARLLGVPTISSFVGGVYTRITHKKDGLLYPYDAPYMLSYYIDSIFSNDKFAEELSINGRNTSIDLNNPKNNTEVLHRIYKSILEL